jgi:putative toxin-antitoxin system antitoxin component (TIGR02293 family)
MAATSTNLQSRLDKEISRIVKNTRLNKQYMSGSGTITYSDFLANRMMMIMVIRQGVPYSLFSLISSYTPFTESDWAKFLDISTKSLHRYKQTSKSFKPIHSEKIIELAEVTKVGMDVFGKMEKFKLWLETPNYALGNIKPLDLLSDSYGKELVISELVRINYGILV